MTVAELASQLEEMIANGQGAAPIRIVLDGSTAETVIVLRWVLPPDETHQHVELVG